MSRSATTTCGGHRALARAADLLDAYPRLAVLSARVLVGDRHEIDPACERMAQSPLDGHGLPGPALIAFMAGAYVVRVEAYRATGGYEPRFFLGAEEALMALDLAALGWRMAYAGDVVTHHHPSRARPARKARPRPAQPHLAGMAPPAACHGVARSPARAARRPRAGSACIGGARRAGGPAMGARPAPRRAAERARDVRARVPRGTSAGRRQAALAGALPARAGLMRTCVVG